MTIRLSNLEPLQMQASKPPPALMSIGELAAAADTAPDTVRYYERIGLLLCAPRTRGRQRIYRGADLQRLRFIRRARALGFTLQAIGSLLALAAPGRRSCASVRAIAADHLQEVRMRLAELRRLEGALAETVERCSGRAAPACAVLSLLEDGGKAVAPVPAMRR